MATRERFVDEPATKNIVGMTFITVLLVIFAMLSTILLVWSYQKELHLFITIFSVIVLAYCIMMLIFVIVTRKNLSDSQFRIYLSGTVFMLFLAISMVIIFTIATVNIFKKTTEVPAMATTPVVPRPLERYTQQPLTQGYSEL